MAVTIIGRDGSARRPLMIDRARPRPKVGHLGDVPLPGAAAPPAPVGMVVLPAPNIRLVPFRKRYRAGFAEASVIFPFDLETV